MSIVNANNIDPFDWYIKDNNIISCYEVDYFYHNNTIYKYEPNIVEYLYIPINTVTIDWNNPKDITYIVLTYGDIIT